MFDDLELKEILRDLLSKPSETEVVEFKRAENSFSDNELGEYFSALSNEANLKGVPSAWLVFGIDNDTHEVKGTNYKSSRASLDGMKKKIADQTTNRITFSEIYELFYSSKRVVMFEIPAASRGIPTAFKGHYYGRDGESLVALNIQELETIRDQQNTSDWSSEVCKGAAVDDIDSDAVEYFVEHGIESGRVPKSCRKDTVTHVLESLNLFDASGNLKKSAVLLFGKNPLRFIPGVRFRIGRFGESETELITQDVVEGDVIRMADRVIELLKIKYLNSLISYEGLQRKETLEIPEEVLRELIYNAIVHKDYRGVDIQLQVFSDRIVLWNEGVLPSGYTVETLLHPHKSRARNQSMADVFFRAGFIETWGRGIGRVCEVMAASGLESPQFNCVCGGVEVVVKREVSVKKINGQKTSENGQKTSENGQKTSENGQKTSENGQKTYSWLDEISQKDDLKKDQKDLLIAIMKQIENDDRVTQNTLVSATGKVRATVQKYLQYLVENDYIVRVGPDKGGRWQINDEK